MIQIPEATITGVRPLRFGDVSITLKVKKEDIDRNAIEQLWDSGISVAVVLQEFGEPKDDDKEIKVLRQTLASYMQTYSEKQSKSIESLKQGLYDRYKVSSRVELTKEQLNSEIEMFKAGVRFD